MDNPKDIYKKLWRLIKVIYFICSVPALLFGSYNLFISQRVYRNGYVVVPNYFKGVLFILLLFTFYIILTDLVRRLLSYINNGTFVGFIKYSEKAFKKISFLLVLIIALLTILSISVDKECTSENQFFDNNGICKCKSGTVKINNLCSNLKCNLDGQLKLKSGYCGCSFNYIQTKNGNCKKDAFKEYSDNNISFRYPSKLLVSTQDFNPVGFFEKENIYVKKYDFSSLIGECILSRAEQQSNGNESLKKKIIEALTKENQEILKKAQEGHWNNNPIDHYTCFGTVGPISIKQVKINNTYGLLINYYLTQEPNAGDITEFYTEILLIKDFKNIYSITFKNNFGGALDYINKFKKGAQSSNMSLIDNMDDTKAIQITRSLVDFYVNKKDISNEEYRGFADNDKIINEIIESIKIKLPPSN